MVALTRSEHTTHCPYKGDASYYSITAGGDRSRNAVWIYETPFEAMSRSRITSRFYLWTVSARSVNRRARPWALMICR